MKSRIFLLLFIPFGTADMSGQESFSFELSGTYGFIPEMQYSENTTISITRPAMVQYTIMERYEMKPGVEMNFSYERNLFHRFGIASGIGFTLDQYKRVMSIEIEDPDEEEPSWIIINPGLPMGNFYGEPGDIRFEDVDPRFNDTTVISNPNTGETKIAYLTIPVSVQYTIVHDRLKIGIGVVNSFIAFSSQIKTRMDLTERRFVQTEYDDTSSDGLNNYQLSARFRMQFRVLKGLWLNAGYRHGLNPLYDEGLRMAGEARNRQFSLGLLYSI